MAKKPLTWEEYEYGASPRQGSVASVASRVHFDDETPEGERSGLSVPPRGRGNSDAEGDLRRRRCVQQFVRFSENVVSRRESLPISTVGDRMDGFTLLTKRMMAADRPFRCGSML